MVLFLSRSNFFSFVKLTFVLGLLDALTFHVFTRLLQRIVFKFVKLLARASDAEPSDLVRRQMAKTRGTDCVKLSGLRNLLLVLDKDFILVEVWLNDRVSNRSLG